MQRYKPAFPALGGGRRMRRSRSSTASERPVWTVGDTVSKTKPNQISRGGGLDNFGSRLNLSLPLEVNTHITDVSGKGHSSSDAPRTSHVLFWSSIQQVTQSLCRVTLCTPKNQSIIRIYFMIIKNDT